MTDRPNSPIRIPIRFVDGDDENNLVDSGDDDVIEIDGDAVDGDLEDSQETPIVSEGPVSDARDMEPADDDEGEEAEESGVEITAEIDGDELGRAAAAQADEKPRAEKPELSIEAFADLTRELRQKTEMVERLLTEKNDLYDKLLRKQAEFENFRKRSERETQEIYRRSRADILLDILPALDNFELAVRHSESADAQALREGFQLIYRQLTDVLARYGLEVVEAEGKTFDPELHEAVATEVNEQVEDHTVLEEFQRGYKIGDKLLRPARVKVSTQG